MTTAPVWLHDFTTKLPLLIQQLRAAGFSVGTDTCLHIQTLLQQLQTMQQLPASAEQMAAYIQPLVSCNAEQQQTFVPLYLQWWHGSQVAPNVAPPLTNQAVIQTHTKPASLNLVDFANANIRSVTAVVVVMLLSVIAGVWFFNHNQGTELSVVKQEQASPEEQVAPNEKTAEDKQIRDPALQIPIKPIPEKYNKPQVRSDILPLVLDEQGLRQQQVIRQLISAFPLVVLLAIWAWYYWRRRYYLNKHKADKNSPLQYLVSAKHRLQPFSWLDFTKGLGRSKLLQSRRYDINKTVDASLRQAGLFVPVYAHRRTPISIVMLVDRCHSDDLQGELALILANELRAQGLAVDDYEFNQDPRFCYSRSARHARISLQKLLAQQSESHLLLISDGQALFHPFRRELLPWAKTAFSPFAHKILLTTTQAHWGRQESLLSTQLGFHISPFSSEGLQAVHQWLGTDKGKAASGDGQWFQQHTLLLPALIRFDAEQWLSSTPVEGYHFTQLVSQLRLYCGPKGVTLLAACAVYPEILPTLTNVLNVKLFPYESAKEKEQRLLRLNQLPWCRLAHMPDYLRQDFIAWLAAQPSINALNSLQNVVRIYQEIFAELGNTPWQTSATTQQANALLRFAPQQAKQSRKAIKQFQRYFTQWLKHTPNTSQWADRIFIDAMLTAPTQKHTLFIPQRLANALNGRAKPYRFYAASLAITALTCAGLMLLWQPLLASAVTSVLVKQMVQQAGQTQVQLVASNQAELGVATVQRQLMEYGFRVEQSSAAERLSLTNTTEQSITENKLTYAPNNERHAQQIITLMQQLYGSQTQWHSEVDSRLPANTIRLPLASPPQSSSVFTDPLVTPLPDDFTLLSPSQAEHPSAATQSSDESTSQVETSNTSIQLPDGSLLLEPTMVAIPAGEFLMGSTEEAVQKNLADSDELPQHKVTIGGFYMSATEVTFAQYEQFAKATQRNIPDDEGWGRGDRPVINVRWDDAQAYTQWLAEQTGKHYRLPTEAEWEYAARAGTQTAFNTGDCLTAQQANFDARFAFNDCEKSDSYLQKTVAVGSYPANAFGLFDMHGNVWEWTADCWHGDYNGAPIDGAAWEASNEGDCSRHMVRGGSWLTVPGYARSANRDWDNLNGTLDFVGFRLARTL